jgi:hypothetical protein
LQSLELDPLLKGCNDFLEEIVLVTALAAKVKTGIYSREAQVRVSSISKALVKTYELAT